MKQFLLVHTPNGRKEDTVAHLRENGICPEVVECEQGNAPYINILATVKKLIRDNFEQDYIIVYEDDVRLYTGFSPEVLVGKLNGGFSMVSTGSFRVGNTRPTAVSGVMECTHYYGAQCVIYHKSSYRFVLAIGDDHIDAMSRYIPNTGIVVPFLTYQKDYDGVNKDNLLIKREDKFKEVNKRLMELST